MVRFPKDLDSVKRHKPSTEHFECLRCGNCCRDFKGKVDPKEAKKAQFRWAKRGIYCSLQPKDVTLGVSVWEKDFMVVYAKSHSTDLTFLPGYFIVDRQSDNLVALNYVMVNQTTCPFLDAKNSCIIYDKRPLLCKSYPIMGLPERRIEYPECKGWPFPKSEKDIESVFVKMSKSDMVKVFGETVGYALISDYPILAAMNALQGLVTNGSVRPDGGLTLSQARKMARLKKSRDVFHMAIEEGVLRKEELRAMLNLESAFMRDFRRAHKAELEEYALHS